MYKCWLFSLDVFIKWLGIEPRQHLTMVCFIWDPSLTTCCNIHVYVFQDIMYLPLNSIFLQYLTSYRIILYHFVSLRIFPYRFRAGWWAAAILWPVGDPPPDPASGSASSLAPDHHRSLEWSEARERNASCFRRQNHRGHHWSAGRMRSQKFKPEAEHFSLSLETSFWGSGFLLCLSRL